MLTRGRFLSLSVNLQSPGPAVLDTTGAVSCKLDFLDEPQQKRIMRLFLAVWVVPCTEEACGNLGILLQIIK
eukprot:4366309-Ditylum_brightwellii.AAC.2